MTTYPKVIMDLEDFNESINWLLYGDSGVGKTVLSGSLPNVLFLAAELGTTSAKRYGSKGKVWKIRKWDDFEDAYDWIEANPKAFDWIVIDSLTALQQRCIRWILDRAVADNPKRDLDIPAIQDHYKWQQMMRRYVTMFNELPVNVLWTAQAMRKEDADGEDIVLPLIQGKDYEIAAWVCAQMDLFTYYEVRKVEKRNIRRLYGAASPPFWAKDRFGATTPYVDNPVMSDLLEAIAASGSKRRTTRTARPASKSAAPRRRAS